MKVIDFIFAARPMLLLPVWSIYLLAFKLRYPYQAWEDSNTLALVSLTLISAGAYYINQIFDYDSDLINQKIGFLQKDIISRSQMMAAYLSVSVVSVIAAFCSDFMTVLIIILIGLLGLAYSASPLRLKDRPIGGLLANVIAYGILVPLTAVTDIGGDIHLIYIIFYFCLLVAAGYLLTIIPDREGDQQTGKMTLAAGLSDRQIIMSGLALVITSLLMAFLIFNAFLVAVSTVSICLFVIALLTPDEKAILFTCKLPILLVSLLAGYYFPAYLVFMLVLLVMTRLYYKKRFGIIYPRIN
ncbi:MAG: hypothetical protein CVT49_12605 [candidate division Zixibacteria bacterium HGW-Zixibacteria-1]|nr:MAG: hypothetical protein CVT49_12605 [candidate division Zixibacteria bacterium HGW-Zixibacteria-1]